MTQDPSLIGRWLVGFGKSTLLEDVARWGNAKHQGRSGGQGSSSEKEQKDKKQKEKKKKDKRKENEDKEDKERGETKGRATWPDNQLLPVPVQVENLWC